MADAVAIAGLLENSGAASPILCQGVSTKKIQFGSLGLAGDYKTGGVPIPSDVSTFFKELKVMILNPKDGYSFEFIPDTQKIKVGDSSEGSELTNGTIINITDIQFIAVGF